MERIHYGGWDNCYRLQNESVEVIVTADVGPRIIRLGRPGAINLFKEFPDMMGLKDGDEWRIYGGHRLWHAPESKPRTYHPDNRPVHVEEMENGIRTVQEVESSTGIEKQMAISIGNSGPYVNVMHRLVNHNLWPVTLSVWAVSVMAPGGIAILPQPPYRPHEKVVTPSHPMVLWPYTTMNDPRWLWGEKFIQLQQDPNAETPQKIGMALPAGKAYYLLDNYLFIKRFDHIEGADYPDFGCSFETFTNSDMLELESLSPLKTVQPGCAAEHKEQWTVLENVDMTTNEAQIEKVLTDVL